MEEKVQSKSLMLESFIKNLESRNEALEEFDERVWMVAIDKVTVMPDNRLTFQFKDGTEVIK